MPISRYGILSPELAGGLKLDYPPMLLPKAFRPESSNVRIQDGEIHRAKMRSAIFADNYCLQFDGSSGYVNVPNASELNIDQVSCSFSFWVYYVVTDESGIQTICFKGSTSPYYNIYINTNGQVGFAESTHSAVESKSSLVENQWTHIVIVRNSSGSISIYLNGSLDRTATVTIPDITNTDALIFGTLASSEWFFGSLDDFRIYKKVLTLAQVQAIYNGGTGTKYTAAAAEGGAASVAYNCDDASGSTLADAVGSNDGTLHDGVAFTTSWPQAIPMPDGNPVLKFHLHTDITDTDSSSFLAYTKDHVYLWNNGDKSWDELFGCASSCDDWSVCSYGNYVLSTNNLDLVQKWTSGDAAFSDLDGASGLDIGGGSFITAAKWITSFENYVIVGNVTVNSAAQLSSIYWSAIGEYENWDTGDSGSSIIEGDGTLTACGKLADYLIIFKENTMVRLWLVGSTDQWNSSIISDKIGCKAPYSVINGMDGQLYFFASDFTIRSVSTGEVSKPVSPVLRNKIVPALVPYIQATLIDEYGELWFAVPYTNAATGNNAILTYKDGVWDKLDIAVSAFGKYYNETSAITWDSQPAGTWDDWEGTWDESYEETGFPIDVIADYSGYCFAAHSSELDNSQVFEGSFVLSTDLTNNQAMNRFKRLLNLQFYFRNEGSGQVEIEIRPDGQTSWQSAGTVSLAGSGDWIVSNVPVRSYGRHFFVKIKGSNAFRFLGVIFDYDLAGIR